MTPAACGVIIVDKALWGQPESGIGAQ